MMRHVGTITYYNAQKNFGYARENGTDYAIGAQIAQYLPNPDNLLRKGNTIYFSPAIRPGSSARPYILDITRVVERHQTRSQRTPGEEKLLEIFRATNKWLSGWTILEQPYINGSHPDFVLLHPFKGVVIVEVKDWNLMDDTTYRAGQVLGSDGMYHEDHPADQLNRYLECLSGLTFLEPEGFQAHVQSTYQEILSKAGQPCSTERAQQKYPFIERVCFYSRPGLTLEKAREFDQDSQYVWTLHEAELLLDPNHAFSECEEFPWALRLFGYGKVAAATQYYADAPLTPDGKNMFGEYIRRLTCWLDGTDYEKSRVKPYQLTAAQRVLATYKPGACRACAGVAGAGKSLILAQKAADAIGAGRRVLVVSYNITLSNYLRDLCRQQYTGNSRDFNQWLTVDYLHGVLRKALQDQGLSVGMDGERGRNISTREKLRLVTNYTREAIRLLSDHVGEGLYDDVLVDEGNDYQDYEIKFLKEYIYNGRGEFLVMHDPAQRIYSTLSDSGLWGDHSERLGLTACTLDKPYCLPAAAVDLLEKVRKTFHLPGLPVGMPEESQPSYGSIRWVDGNWSRRSERVMEELSYWLKEKLVHPEDLILITPDYRSAEELAEDLEQAGVPIQLCDASRKSKFEFWAGKNNVKIATFHHFKGWHAPYVILVLDSGLTPEEELRDSAVLNAFYVALSRVKPSADTHTYCFRCLNFLNDDRIRALAELVNGN